MPGSFDHSFGPPFGFTVIFVLIAAIIIGTFIFIIVKGITVWSSNNAAEQITVPCQVVAKRTEVSGGSGNSSAHTSYYVTFEFQDGRRQEFHVRSEQFGLLVEGDTGYLTYQGTRLNRFDRQIRASG
ncbi:DUF2500 domain-containing protein [Paenibacillus filicis]|uniref:DUF2500 domain-containing protein n=1 Tax=Paenibacillus filicis TaxID=669464 RepID=A0ABU9DG85_9BACL